VPERERGGAGHRPGPIVSLYHCDITIPHIRRDRASSRSVLLRCSDRAGASDAVVAASLAAVVSGVPSTAHALLAGRNPLEASLAAGTLLLPHEQRRARLLVAAMLAHGLLSLGWAFVLALLLPRRRTVEAAALAGLAIAAMDLGVVGRRFPRIRALPLLPQVLDHVAYAATVALVLRVRRGRRRA
jgi:hypothetical protein